MDEKNLEVEAVKELLEKIPEDELKAAGGKLDSSQIATLKKVGIIGSIFAAGMGAGFLGTKLLSPKKSQTDISSQPAFTWEAGEKWINEHPNATADEIEKGLTQILSNDESLNTSKNKDKIKGWLKKHSLHDKVGVQPEVGKLAFSTVWANQ